MSVDYNDDMDEDMEYLENLEPEQKALLSRSLNLLFFEYYPLPSFPPYRFFLLSWVTKLYMR